MAGWLIFLFMWLLAMLFLWMNDIVFTNKQFSEACKRATERERMKMLMDNSEIYETIAKIDKIEMKIKVEPAETAQPVREPSPADLVLDTVKENKW